VVSEHLKESARTAGGGTGQGRKAAQQPAPRTKYEENWEIRVTVDVEREKPLHLYHQAGLWAYQPQTWGTRWRSRRKIAQPSGLSHASTHQERDECRDTAVTFKACTGVSSLSLLRGAAAHLLGRRVMCLYPEVLVDHKPCQSPKRQPKSQKLYQYIGRPHFQKIPK
jgi:hypothetical protein